MIKFSTLNSDGSVTNVREIKREDMQKCPFSIMVADHYREDGTCKCDDEEHRKMMIKEWEYKKSDFKNIPLRSSR